MPKSRVAASSVPDLSDIEELTAAAGPPTAPENLGNFPGGASPVRVESLEPPPEDPTPEPAEPVDQGSAGPESAELEQPDEVTPEPPMPKAWEDRLTSLERENEFLRRAASAPPRQPPPPPPDPIATLKQYLPVSVTEQDVQTILQDPSKGAEYLQNMMYAAALAGASMATQVGRQEVDQRLAKQSSDTALRDQFWAQHGNLAPYHDIVQLKANEVWAEGARPSDQMIAEVARRTHARLSEMGIRPQGAANAAVRTERVRPARGETGGGSRANGSTKLNEFERDVFQLVNAR